MGEREGANQGGMAENWQSFPRCWHVSGGKVGLALTGLLDLAEIEPSIRFQMNPSPLSSISVPLGDRSYSVEVHDDLGRLGASVVSQAPGRLAIIASRRVFELHGSRLMESLKGAGGQVDEKDVLLVDDGEEFKNLQSVGQLLDSLIGRKHTRRSTVVAFGGGVVGDLAGFVAAIFLRGIRVVQVPTTVVAMVDSAVGGKTGVDHPGGKNLIGAFHQPSLVAIWPGFLGTLDDHNLRGGLAEVIKYGVIRDEAFFHWLEEEGVLGLLDRKSDAVSRAVLRSCAIKAEVVGEDEREREGGTRAHLNFGHTFGHGLEAVLLKRGASGDDSGIVGRLRAWWIQPQIHGQCVAVGMGCGMDLAVRRRLVNQEAVMRLEKLLLRSGLPTRIPPGIAAEEILEAMRSDKKAVAGTLRFVLPVAFGQVSVVDGVEDEEVLKILQGRMDETRA